MRLENSELRAFHALIEEGGFKRAAGALHISQSAVSQAVAGLEDKLGIMLVQRGKELRLTDVGRRVFAHAADVLQGEQRTLEDVAQLKQGRTETLSIALSASINRFYAPELISAYYRQSPDTRLMIVEMPARSIISAVLSGNVELGFGPFQKDMAAFETQPLYSESRHLVVSPGHTLYAQLIEGNERALQRTPLIASALDNPDMRPSIARLRDQFSSVWEVSSLRLRIHMVDQGMGVTFIDGRTMEEHPTCRTFKIMSDISFGRIDKEVGIYYRTGRELSASAVNFIALCRAHWNL
ncbi:MAG: DNA-binding transcriptional LysR family regulator [Bacteroidia bacterium]|jgi:DNA-binding transcriptional LysR family regulator